MVYVGTNNDDINFYVQEVCNDISLLHQICRDEKGCKIMETPEDLYQKYLNFTVSLPFNATDWLLHLPPTFISALDENLRNRITFADDFCMPDLRTISTKSKQSNGLREVRNTAVRHYMNLEEDISKP